MTPPSSHPPIDHAGPAAVEARRFAQKRFSSRTRFELGADEFEYELVADGNARSYRLEYAELSTHREAMTDRNSWWRNVGLIWMGLGLFISVSAYAENGSLRLPIWLWLGLICYGVYQFRVVRYRIIPAERCNVLIIDDAQADAIVAELERRRAAQLRARYDYLTADEHPEQQRQRIEWLRKQGALDANEASARLLQLDAMRSAHSLQLRAQDDEQD